MHMAHNTHTWGGVQLHRVAWDSYVQIPTFFGQEMSNDKFTIPEPIFQLQAKSEWLTILESLIKKNKQG